MTRYVDFVMSCRIHERGSLGMLQGKERQFGELVYADAFLLCATSRAEFTLTDTIATNNINNANGIMVDVNIH